MKLTVRAGEPAFERVLKRLRERGATADASVEPAVRAILDDVRRRGDRAVAEATERFDGVKLKPSERTIERDEMRAACDALPKPELHALRIAARRIRDFHAHQKERSFRYKDALGVTLGQEIRPLRRVGLYVPGGQAFYPSSVLMNALPARVAGVKEIVAVSPPHAGGEPPALLAAAYIAGVDRIHRVGGAQAVAALAYGTTTIPRVDKIVGPGNIYVATAKRLVSGIVGIDMIAGPSEVLIVADQHADPELVAADMLAQAEHDADASAIVVTPSARLAAAVERALDEQLASLPRATTAAKALRANGAILVVKSVEAAVELANELAPEHLELALRDAPRWIARIEHAGAIFVGESTPEAFGDYLAGPNHVLPTGGTARFSSPLGVYDFVKRTSVIQAPQSALERLGRPVLRLAQMEGLEAHGAAVARRLRRPGGPTTRARD
jgi:histidinol dehydrogenase